MKIVKIISVINQGGEYTIAVYYNECDEAGNIIKKNAKAPVYYAVGDTLNAVKALENLVKERLDNTSE